MDEKKAKRPTSFVGSVLQKKKKKKKKVHDLSFSELDRLMSCLLNKRVSWTQRDTSRLKGYDKQHEYKAFTSCCPELTVYCGSKHF